MIHHANCACMPAAMSSGIGGASIWTATCVIRCKAWKEKTEICIIPERQAAWSKAEGISFRETDSVIHYGRLADDSRPQQADIYAQSIVIAEFDSPCAARCVAGSADAWGTEACQCRTQTSASCRSASTTHVFRSLSKHLCCPSFPCEVL